jgi:hypothetical protein
VGDTVAMQESIVSRWFGRTQFEQLHPLLQTLHREGGGLRGPVDIHITGWLGRRLAQRLGVPTEAGAHVLDVTIHHGPTTLHWDRCFDERTRMHSTFVAQGQWPDGCWMESTGPLRLALSVDVVDGAWHWRPLKLWVHGVRLPLWCFPRSHAFKRVENGRYRFSVSFSLPLWGTVLSYGGLLEAVPRRA